MVDTLLRLLFSLAAIGIVVVAIAYFWSWYYAGDTTQDETHYIRAQDGWRLAVHRYRPERDPTGLPVILCHGLSANRYCFDLQGAPGLARYLRNRGWDVWVPELRGSGMSQRPGLGHSDAPYSWDFEDHLHQDLPAILAFVRERTGAPSLHWVGHSMGGMLILAELAAHDNSPFASAVTIGSPMEFSKVKSNEIRLMLQLKPLLRLVPVSPLGFLGRLGIPLVHQLRLGFFHAPNVEPETARKMAALGVELLPSSKLWLTFARFVETERFASEDGEPYLANLSLSKAPILCLGGVVDALAPPESMILTDEAEGHSGERKRVILGRSSGCVEDYGHVDLLVGRKVESEVFPLIHQWLTDHDPVASDGAE
jgi:pimeloyl-ACP methyl ester carboxylesterase